MLALRGAEAPLFHFHVVFDVLSSANRDVASYVSTDGFVELPES
jgi:hypothetical protein